MFDEAELRKALAKEQAVHGKRAGGGAIDIAVPAGTLVPTPVGTPSWGGAGGWQATSLQTGNLFLHGLGTSVASPTGAAAAAAAPPPAAGAAGDMPDATKAADNFAAAVRNLAGAMERMRALQAALTQANTAEAFDQIAKAAFPQIALEQYQDQLLQVSFAYDAVAASSSEAYSPERSAIEVTRLTQIATANRELQQIQQGIAAQTRLSDAERTKALDAINKRYAEYLKGVERETLLKQRILASEQAANFITQMRSQTRGIYEDIEALQLRNRLEAEGVAPEFIAAEVAKLGIQREVNRLTADLTTQLTTELDLRDQLQQKIATASGTDKLELEKRLAESLATIERLRAQLKDVGAAGEAGAAAEDARARAATAPGTRFRSFIADAERNLKDLEGLAIRVSQSITDALANSLANGITGLIEGTTTVKEIFAGFLRDVGQILIKEATKMIATYILIGIAKAFAFGSSGNMGGENYYDPKTGVGVAGPNFGLANGGLFDTNGMQRFGMGGAFTNSIVSSPTLFRFADGGAMRTGVMGEAGPEAIMPLKRGADGKLGVQVADNRAFLASSRAADNAASDTAEDQFSATAATRASLRETERLLENKTQLINQQTERERRYERERIEQMASTPGNLNIRYESQVINNVEYVTREQAERMAAQSALRGRELAIGSLQNSVKTRKRVGMA
jgi:hypothetical protein